MSHMTLAIHIALAVGAAVLVDILLKWGRRRKRPVNPSAIRGAHSQTKRKTVWSLTRQDDISID